MANAQRIQAQDLIPQRRLIAPNVIALWPEDRPAVANPPCTKRSLPKGVSALSQRHRIWPGHYAYLWGGCLPANRGAVVKIIGPDNNHELPNMWLIQSVSRGLKVRNVDDNAVDRREFWETSIQDVNLRRCPAPKGVKQ